MLCSYSYFVYSVCCCFYSLSCLAIFFFMQKTAYEIRISHWSSDVCSSDLSSIFLLFTQRQYRKSPVTSSLVPPYFFMNLSDWGYASIIRDTSSGARIKFFPSTGLEPIFIFAKWEIGSLLG